MSVNPKAPPVYKPTAPRVAGPPVYRPNQVNIASAQLKPAVQFRLESRPAPPAYRPQQNAASAPPLQQKAVRPLTGPATRIQTKPTAGNSGLASQQDRKPSARPHIASPRRTLQAKSKAYKLEKQYRPTELGGKLFLFSRGGRTSLLVSAHGVHKPETKPETITVPPGMTIHFYQVHGETVIDPGLVLPPDDHVKRTTGEEVINYSLSKYQYTHSQKNETYDDIVDAVIGNEFDVLTVRNRKMYSKEVTLQEVLTAIAAYGYKDIYLNACQYAEAFSEKGIKIRREDYSKKGYIELE